MLGIAGNKAKRQKEILEVLKVSTETHEQYFGAYPWPNDKTHSRKPFTSVWRHQTINAYGNDYDFVKMGSG